MEKAIKEKFELAYDCKHSRRYNPKDKDFVVGSIYVKRPWCDGVNEFELTITPKGE